MNITKNFTFEELTRTNTGLDNEPNNESLVNLCSLTFNILQPARELLAMVVKVNSAYRSREVNKAVGGARTSQHTKGQAADLSCSDNIKLFEILRTLPFDQLIIEKPVNGIPSWLHVSYNSENNRGEILVYENGEYTTYE